MILPVLSSPAALYASAAVSNVFQFGTVSLLDMPYADHDFMYTNTGTTPVVIERLQPSCHCTSALIASDSSPDGAALPYTVAPGASVKVHASINLGMDPSGPVSRTVSVYLQGENEPAAIYTLSGTVEPDAEFRPSVLNFGKIRAGDFGVMAVLVIIDSRLIPKDYPNVVSDNPGIVITPVPNPYHGPTYFKAARAGSEVDCWFEVTVPANMPLGRIDASLSMSGGPAATAAAIAQYEINTAVVTGEVTGAIKADPEAISFGTVLTGHTSTETVILTGNTAADIRGLKAQSGSSYITATLSKPGPGRDRRLILTVKKDAPAGLFNSKITVLLVNGPARGQRLVIPTTGYVTIPVN